MAIYGTHGLRFGQLVPSVVSGRSKLKLQCCQHWHEASPGAGKFLRPFLGNLKHGNLGCHIAGASDMKEKLWKVISRHEVSCLERSP